VADWEGIIDQGKLLLEAPLEEIRADFRRVTATGNALPAGRTPQVISAHTSNNVCEYFVRNGADAFVDGLRHQGATVLEVTPLNLEQVFLQLVKKEEPCISGSIGGTPAAVSSSM
jgi:ABC-2 type transport system ATP-binding protein